jgi:UDP-N-acetylmuramate dehydrogenase
VRAEGDAKVPHYDLPDGSVKIPAAWMIDRLGFKGKRRGGAAVHEKQPLVIINATGEASAEDILALEGEICDAVEQHFGVRLHPEVEHL